MTKFVIRTRKRDRATDELIVTVSPDGRQQLEMTRANKALLDRQTAEIGHDEAMAAFMEQVFAEYHHMAQRKKGSRCA